MNSGPLGGNAVGDALNGQSNQALPSDPVRKLAEYQLLREKLSVRSDPRLSEEAKKILGAESELDNLELKILLKLSHADYAESTAEFQRLVDLTGADEKIGIAKWLAQHIYAKARGKYVLQKFSDELGANGSVENLRTAGAVRGGAAAGSPAALFNQFLTSVGLQNVAPAAE
jgi:hypothetical protein